MPARTLIACWGCGSEAAAPDPRYPVTGYWRCDACGLLFAPDRGSAEAESALYDAGYFAEYPGGEDYESDDDQRRFEAGVRLPFVRRQRPSGRLLEIGAAAGHFLRAAADAGYDVVGIEPAAEVAARGAAREGVDLRPGLLETADLPEGAFDVVCAWHVLEHIPEPRGAVERMAALLAPGGALCLEVPNVTSALSERDGEQWFHLDPRHHVNQFTPAALRGLLERSGLQVTMIGTVSALRYLRPARALHPRGLAAMVKETLAVGAPPFRGHPNRHELLRMAAHKPG
jgi:2-polyprenyl-3-methyl-5-hydroxy-6-metoxy-1,4-benzoquinol methylase